MDVYGACFCVTLGNVLMWSIHFSTFFGLFVGYWFERACVWIALDLLNLHFATTIAVFNVFGMLMIGLIATHFTIIEGYKRTFILAAKYLVPAGLLTALSHLI